MAVNRLARSRIASLWLVIAAVPLAAQQVADQAFRPPIAKPAYQPGKGPVVLIDEAHENFHTESGRYRPFADLLRRDGYVVEASTTSFTAETLRRAAVLVIANATQPLTAAETAAVRGWTSAGHSLLLIADHPPYSAVAAALGTTIGIHFSDGVARDRNASTGRLVFRRSDKTLMDHPITAGLNDVATFTGTSFQLEVAGEPLLVFGSDVYSFQQPADPNPSSVQGHLQGAVLRVGKGRVAVFGEAAMFSAQLSGPDRNPMGMNAEIAKDNAQFLLNVMHWLTR